MQASLEQHSFAVSAEMTRDDTTVNGLVVGNITPGNNKSSNFISVNIVKRCLISHGNLQNSNSYTKTHRGLQDLHPLPPPPQCHVSPTQLLIAGLLKDGGVKEGLGLNKKKKERNCSVLRRDSFLNSFKKILKTINYVM